MAKRKNEEKRKYWRGVLERHARSGVSVARFCRSEGVSEASFYSWKRILGASPVSLQKPGRSGTRQEAVGRLCSRRARHLQTSPSFVPVRITEEHRGRTTIRVTWPSGLTVQIPTASDPTEVRAVLQAVDALTRQS